MEDIQGIEHSSKRIKSNINHPQNVCFHVTLYIFYYARLGTETQVKQKCFILSVIPLKLAERSKHH